MSDFDDSYESSIFSDASSSSIDDMIFSDEPPSDDSLDDSVGDLEESRLEEDSEKQDENSNSISLPKPVPEIPMTGYLDESIHDPSSEDIIDSQRKLENKYEILDFSLQGLEVSDERKKYYEKEENGMSFVAGKKEYEPPLLSLANLDMDSYRKCADVLRPHPHLRRAFLEPRMAQSQKVSIKVDPPLTPLKSILRSRTGSDNMEDHIEYIKRRSELRSGSKPNKTEENIRRMEQDLTAERPEHTEYRSAQSVKEEFLAMSARAPSEPKEKNSSKPRFSPRDRIYDSLSESTKARLEKLKQERKEKNAEINGNDAAPSPQTPKFNYAKLEMIKNRFEEQQKKKAGNSFEMTMMQEEREEQKRRHRETLKKFERMST